MTRPATLPLGRASAIGPRYDRGMKDEFSKYPNIYRPREAMNAAMPVGMAGIFVAILTLMQSVAYFAEWTVVGLVIGLIYK